MCFLINHVPVGLISDTGNAAVKVQFKNDGLEEDTVASPVIYGDHTPLWEPFSGIGPYIFLNIFLYT